MRLQRRPRQIPRLAVALIGLAAAIIAGLPPAAVTLAADEPIRLAVEPVGVDGQFFEVSLAPGESSQLIVDLANYGTKRVTARTFAADVYPIINGGFGARLRGEPATGTTTWLDYASDILEIDPGQAIRRTFSVTVPPTTEPGEYITSIIIENEDPLSSGQGVAFNQFVRSAVAVVVVVPGPAEAALQLGVARHSFLEGQSVVGVAIENVGDLLLRPVGSLSVTTEAGEPVVAREVAMDSVYAHASTWLEVILDRPLAPGRYFANVDVTDPGRGGPASGARLFVVEQDPAPPPSTGPDAVATDTVDLPIIGTLGRTDRAVLAFGVGAFVAAFLIGVLVFARRRRRATRSNG